MLLFSLLTALIFLFLIHIGYQVQNRTISFPVFYFDDMVLFSDDTLIFFNFVFKYILLCVIYIIYIK